MLRKIIYRQMECNLEREREERPVYIHTGRGRGRGREAWRRKRVKGRKEMKKALTRTTAIKSTMKIRQRRPSHARDVCITHPPSNPILAILYA